MAGGHMKYRHLSRSSSHRRALLRNLVTSLVEHESITTTWHKAKEAQRMAEKLITLGKRNTNASRSSAQSILMTPFSPTAGLVKVFGELRTRYLDRPGGYTRVLRTEPRNRKHDQAETAILEFVDGPRDMRFAMTARSVVRERAGLSYPDPSYTHPKSHTNTPSSQSPQKTDVQHDPGTLGVTRDITARNVLKVTRFRPDGEAALLAEVERLEIAEVASKRKTDLARKQDEKAAKKKHDKDQSDSSKQKEEPEEEEYDEWEDDEDGDLSRTEHRLRTGRREGWERFDEYNTQQRKLRKLRYKVGDVRRRMADRKEKIKNS